MSTPLRVLIVEDDSDDFSLTCELLREDLGARVQIEWASTYEAGEDLVRQNRHDLYLFDYRLGAKTGLDLLRVSAAIGCTAPVIMLTGQDADGIDIEAVRAGAADYLRKGEFDARLLGRSIRYSMERKRMEAALRASEERYRDLLENAHDMIFTHNCDGIITTANRATERITGYSRAELIGTSLLPILADDSRAKFERLHVRKMAGEDVGAYELNMQAKTGDTIVVEITSRLIRDGQNSLECQAIGRDVTQRKAAEEQLRAYAVDIERKNSELSAALEALRHKWSRWRHATTL
jgi:PAS domain S-box-containing protein